MLLRAKIVLIKENNKSDDGHGQRNPTKPTESLDTVIYISETNKILTRPRGYNFFSFSTQLSMKFVLLINLDLLTTANSFLLNIAEPENISPVE